MKQTQTQRLSRFLAVGLLIFAATNSFFIHILPVSAAAGDSPEDPILITDCEELQVIDSDQANYSKHYALDSDIDCEDSAGWDSGKGFNPIASNDVPFTGSFNGNHHTITNLTILRADDDPDTNYGNDPGNNEQSVGLFAWTQNAEIYDLNIDLSKVKGYEFVGGIVGWAETTTLTNVSFNATVKDNSCDPGHCVWARYGYVGGGLVGMLHNSNVVNGVTAGPVKGSGNIIGGLVGQVGANSSITSSSSSSNIDGGNELGGAVGSMLGGDLEDVHASGNVDANDDEGFKNGYAAGGLVGRMESAANVTRSSATGNVHADYSSVGGLVGLKEGTGSVTDSYARGNVSQADGWTTGGKVGGLIGEVYGGVFERTYASGSTSGEYNVGGLVGFTDEESDITLQDSFAAGQVTATSGDPFPNDGGLVGFYDWNTELDNNYYDADRTEMDHCYSADMDGPWESSPTIADECNAVSEDIDYFYDQLNQPFNDGEAERWDSEIWDFHEDDYPTLDCEQCEVIEDEGSGTAGISFSNAENGKPIKLITPDGTTITCHSSVKESNLSVQDAGYQYPVGLVDFCFSTTEGSNEVVLIFVTDLKPDQVTARKYNPATNTYSNVSGVSITETAYEGQHALQAAYTIQDNGPLDLDPDEGEIADPIGLASAVNAPNTGALSVRERLFIK